MSASRAPRRRAVRALVRVTATVAGLLVACCSDDAAEVPESVATCSRGESEPCRGEQDCAGQRSCDLGNGSYGPCACPDGATVDAGAISTPPDAASAPPLPAVEDATSAEMDAAALCGDECDPDAPSLCSTGSLGACWIDPFSGCAVALEVDCRRGLCADENHCYSCVDECPYVGASGCAKGALGVCEADADGCLKWQLSEVCASGFCGSETACGTCANDCEVPTTVECSNGQTRVCIEDDYGCRAWTAPSECPLPQCATASACVAGYSIGQRGTPFDDEAWVVLIDKRGTVATAGSYHRSESGEYRADSDAYLQARSADMTLLKTSEWGSDADDAALAATVDSEYAHLVAGFTAGRMAENPHRGGRDAFVAKWGNDSDEPLWIRQWGSPEHDTARAVVVDAADNVLVIGNTSGQIGSEPALGADDVFVTAWDSAGNRLYSAQWGSPFADVAADAARTSSGDVVIAGRTMGALGVGPNLGAYDAFVALLDEAGRPVNVAQLGTDLNDAAESIAIDAAGNIYVAGTTQGALGGNPTSGGLDAFLLKLAPDLTVTWSKTWGTAADDIAEALALDSAGNPVLALTVQASAEPACPAGEAWVVRWDANGTQNFSESWDSCAADAARDVAVRPDGQLLIVGSTRGDLVHESRGGTDIFSITLQP